MAMFVRNPTKDWSELERPQIEQDSGFDKQVLKAMIERKRQNDFIRKREFDQLRKLRSKGVSAVVANGRPSAFQSSIAGLTDPDGRAITLKKIDEIEAQMSKQWWKGKQDAAAAKGGGFPVAKHDQPEQKFSDPVPSAQLTDSEQFEKTEVSDLRSGSNAPNIAEFLPTEMGNGMEPMPAPQSKGRSVPMKVPAVGALAQSFDGDELGFSASKLFAIDVEDMATDPELEEAAIRFANGDDAGAEGGLLDALRGVAVSPEVANSWIAALLDLYRATHNKTSFDQAVAEFSVLFETIVPQWAALGEEPLNSGLAKSRANAAGGSVPDTRDYCEGAIWCSPAELNAYAMEGLRDAMASSPMPWHLDWSKLVRICEDAMPLMGGLFSSLCNEPVALLFSGADRLVDTLRTMMPSGDRSVNRDWWTIRLDALRTLQMLDDFELAALDYCVTYEVSPPAWQQTRCQYSSVEAEVAAAVAATAHRSESSGSGSGFSQMPTMPMGIDGVSGTKLELKGSVLGDATQALAGFSAAGRHGDGIVVSCRGLIRVDFSAAGSILNWVAMREAEGCQVQFREVHRLVAAFFNVIGINEHARVVPRAI
jgi:anti-anti-sigma regulatory factor